MPVEPPLGLPVEPPLELPVEPPLGLPPLLPEPPCGELELFPALQAATRNAREALMIHVRVLFIAQPRLKCGHGRGSTAVRRCLFVLPFFCP
jgi:hypothetical protein